MFIDRGGSDPGVTTRRRFAVLAAAASLALAAVGLTGQAVGAQSNLDVTVGVGDGTVAGQAFMPGDITVGVGDSVTFSIGSDDPHTITLGEGPMDVPPPFWPVSGFAAPEESAPPPYDLGTVAFDGTNFINTGILFGKGSSATIEFTSAGTFPFHCAIHEGMDGVVNVVEDGPVTSQAEADAAAELTREALLEQVEPVRQARLEATSTVDNEDGSQTWNIFTGAGTEAGPMPGGGIGHLELLEFAPAAIEIEPGDTISWTSDRVHTVTFVPDGLDPSEVFPSLEAGFVPMGGATYDGTETANSGVFNFALDPEAPPLIEYSLTFPEPGVYPYFCAIHAELGQLGVVAVGVPLPEAPA